MELTDYNDITGTNIRVELKYREKDASGPPTDHVIPPVLLPPALRVPLSDFVNQSWAVKPDIDGKTRRDHARDTVFENLQKIGAFDIDGNFPAEGHLFALVSKRSFMIDGVRQVVPILDLVYSLPNTDFTFNISLAAFRLTFDSY